MIVKIKHKVIFLILIFLSVSCQDLKKTEKPVDLIPEDKMIDVLTEIALLHAARTYNKNKLENTGIQPYEYIYRRYNIDSLQFKRSNNYYTDQYSQYERIYDSVKLRLQMMKTRLDSLRDREVRIEDSIKLARKDSIRALDSIKVGPGKIDSLKINRKVRLKEDLIKDSLIAPPGINETSRPRN